MEKSKINHVTRIALIVVELCILTACIFGLVTAIRQTYALPDLTYTDFGLTISYNFSDAQNRFDVSPHRLEFHTNRQPIPAPPFTVIVFDVTSGNVYLPNSFTVSSVNGTEYGTTYYEGYIDSDTDGAINFFDVDLTGDVYLYYVPFQYVNGTATEGTVSALLGSFAQTLKPSAPSYDDGYNAGVADQQNDFATGVATITSVINAPFQAIANALNFSIFGINLAALFFFLITASLLVFAVKIFASKG